jgi:hypothetical protein
MSWLIAETESGLPEDITRRPIGSSCLPDRREQMRCASGLLVEATRRESSWQLHSGVDEENSSLAFGRVAPS